MLLLMVVLVVLVLLRRVARRVMRLLAPPPPLLGPVLVLMAVGVVGRFVHVPLTLAGRTERMMRLLLLLLSS